MSIREQPAQAPDELLWRLTVPQYHQMARTGILTDDDPVELLEGCLVTKMAKNPAHRLATRLVRTALESAVPEGWFVEAQEPITLETSEPEPDVFVARGEPRDYAHRHPGPEEIALVVEVADTTLERDRRLKGRIYARAGIAEYWILNLSDRRLERYLEPVASAEGWRYQSRTDFGAEESVPFRMPGAEVSSLSLERLLP
jgi:Uma2 family endonuclease